MTTHLADELAPHAAAIRGSRRSVSRHEPSRSPALPSSQHRSLQSELGLWLLLLIAPVGARFMVAPDNGNGLQVSVGGHLPVMTSATLGVTLGIIVSTLLLPIGFIYLRSNVTRTQPWQIEEVTPASRVAISLGRFAADVTILFAILAALTVAGWFLGWLVGSGPLNPWHISLTLWLVAAPTLMGLAALRMLVDSLKITRGGLGDTLFFALWMTALIVPAVLSALPSSYAVNMLDFTGFLRPLTAHRVMRVTDHHRLRRVSFLAAFRWT